MPNKKIIKNNSNNKVVTKNNLHNRTIHSNRNNKKMIWTITLKSYKNKPISMIDLSILLKDALYEFDFEDHNP